MSDGAAEATRVLAIRHGETAWNAQARIQGQLDVPLNARGRWQAAQLVRALADEPLAAVYASDLARARETAVGLAAAAGVPLHTDRALRERGFGSFEGRSFSEIEAAWPDESLRWRRREPDFAPGGGETLVDFHARTTAAAARLAASHPGATIALVAHGGVLDCLYRAATGIDLQAPRTWALGNASINRLLWNGATFTVVGWADDRHLEAEDRGGA